MERPGINPNEIRGNKELGLRSFGRTLASTRHPDHNEDAIAHSATDGFAVVLDGVGGEINGEKASKTAQHYLTEKVLSIIGNDPREISEQLKQAFQLAHAKVIETGGQTTATLVKVVGKGKERNAIIGHVGDSRAYLLRDGRLKQITEDDSAVMSSSLPENKRRDISSKLDEVATKRDLSTLNQQEEAFFKQRNLVSQVLGGPRITTHIYQVGLRSGDKVILTSDGVHDNLTRKEIETIMKSKQPDLASALAEEARKRSGQTGHIRAKADDISAVVIEVGELVQNEKQIVPQQERSTQTFDLSGGKEVAINYKGTPIKVQLSGNLFLEIGRPEDLALGISSSVDFLIVDKPQFTESGREQGYKGLRDKETVILGRENTQRFTFNDSVSRQHLRIMREGNKIIIKDLNSTNGTQVQI